MMSTSNRDDLDNSSASDVEKGEAFKEKDDVLPEREAPVQEEPAALMPTTSEQPDSQTTPEISVTDWNGPDDPENPHNWTRWKKIYHSLIPGLFGFAVTFGTSVYTAASEDIMQHFHVSRTVALTGITVYTLGLAFGPVITAPLSENYGRKIVYIATSPPFMLFTLGAGLSQSIGSLIVCRFFSGLMGSSGLAVGGGTNTDLFPPQKRAVATSFFLMAPFAGPSLGPIVGGFAAQYKGWRWTQWCMLFITITAYVLAIPTHETYKPIILKRRAKKLGIKPAKSCTANATAMKKTIVQNFLRPMHMLVTEPVVFFLSLYTAFAFGVLFLFFAAFPYVFQRPPYSFTISQSGLTFIAIGVGVLLGGLSGIIVDRTIYQGFHRKAVAKGNKFARPEHRLYNAMMGSWGIPIGLFWFGWTADKGVHWAVPLLGSIPFAWGNICLFTSAVLYMVDVYGSMYGASAIAANGIIRYIFGGVFPLFTVQMYSAMGVGWATSLLGFVSVLMLPIPWIFFKWGPLIRKRSTYPVAM